MMEVAVKYHNTGLSVIPVNEAKEAIVKGWRTERREPNAQMRYTAGLAIVCGPISGGVECVDIDLKYDTTGTLFSRYKHAIKEAAPGLLEKLVVEKSPSGGYHFIYKCEKNIGNLKLAQRYATSAETGKNHQEKIKVLLETRGEGGYFVCAPSPGYSLTYGSLESINFITPDERDTLLEVARTFNEVFTAAPITYPKTSKQYTHKTPIDDYNDRGNPIEVLEKHGWKAVDQKAAEVFLKRPGETKTPHAGGYNLEKKCLYVFSTSTVFDSEKAYGPAAIYCKLECNDNWKDCVKKLLDEGYGEKAPAKIDEVVINPETDDFTFITDTKEVELYIHDCINGTKIMGIDWGMGRLDNYFKFKHGSFNVINGHQNVGKSTFLWYLLLVGALNNGHKWIIYSPENKAGYITRKLIEFFWGKVISHTTEYERRNALEWIYEHFTIIGDKEYFSYSDIIKAAEKTIEIKHFDGILVDPYNALKINVQDYRALGGHEYHYQAASLYRIFCKRYNCAMYLNTHSVTEAQRKKGADGKMPAPYMSDIEGGGKWGNKADDFMTLHRYVGDTDVGNHTMIYIRKIKEVETGGKVTPPSEPLTYKFENWCKFVDEDGVDPVHLAKTNTPF